MARADIAFTLMEALSDRHVALPINDLLNNIEKKDFIFLTGYYIYEKNIAAKLHNLQKGKVSWYEFATKKAN